jgi:hypothetical protein
MTIKATIQSEESVACFPKLMKHRNSNMIVLMTIDRPNADGRRGKGMVVTVGAGNAVGDFSENWAMDNFVDFKGVITLSNNQ